MGDGLTQVLALFVLVLAIASVPLNSWKPLALAWAIAVAFLAVKAVAT